jgi:hypothetical protein
MAPFFEANDLDEEDTIIGREILPSENQELL